MGENGGEEHKFEMEQAGGMPLGETTAGAAAEHAKALIQAKFIMAMNRPRNFDDVRTKLMGACRRPRFAEVARYNKPVGRGVQGPSIRFADEAAKIMGNVDVSKMTIFEDDDKLVVHIIVIDLETNTSKGETVTIRKTVERKNRQGRDVLGERINSSGQTVHIVRATDDEVFNKEQLMCAKVRRNLELQLIPQDIIDECQDVCAQVKLDRTAKDPDGERKRLIDAFAEIGVKPSDLEKLIEHPLDAASAKEIQGLREVYVTIRDGEASWADYFSEDALSAGKDDPFKPGRKTHKPKDGDKGDEKPKAEDPPADEPEEPAKEDDPEAPAKGTTGKTLAKKYKEDITAAQESAGVLSSNLINFIGAEFGAESIDQLEKSQVPAVLDWIKEQK